MGTRWKRYPAAKRGVPAYRQAGKQQPATQDEKKDKVERLPKKITDLNQKSKNPASV